MKKILVLCLSLVLVMTCNITVFAYDDYSAGSGETEIIARVYSNYSISIPATIDLTAGMMGEVTISDANLESGYKVDVFVTNLNDHGGITLTHTGNSVSELYVMLNNIELNTCVSEQVPLVSFKDTELSGYGSTATKYFDIHIPPYGNAGRYSGTMTYSFSCNPYT